MSLVSKKASAEQENWTSRKRMVDVGGLGMAYVEVAGSKPALLLVHGFTDTSRSFSLLAPHLVGHRLIIPDLRGHGASQARAGCSLADFADDIAGLIGELRLELPVLIGHSLGAMIALEMAARTEPPIGGLVLLAGTLKPEIPDNHPMVAGVQALSDPISPADPFYAYWHACRPDVPAVFLACMAKEASTMPVKRWQRILEQLRRADLSEVAPTVQAKTLVIGGAGDLLFGDTHQQALLRALTEAVFVRAENCGHNPHWEDPALVAEAILKAFY